MCHPGSIAAFSRTLSPASTPLHVTGCTIWAAANNGMSNNNIVNNRFISYILYPPRLADWISTYSFGKRIHIMELAVIRI